MFLPILKIVAWTKTQLKLLQLYPAILLKRLQRKPYSDCRSLLTFNSDRETALEKFDYLLKLLRGGLTLPSIDLMHYVSKSFAMLALTENIIHKIEMPE